MKLKKIEVKNYRILKDFKLDFKDETTLIIGKNNTGKTSVLAIMDKLLNQGKKNFKWDDFNIEFQNKIYEKDPNKKLYFADTLICKSMKKNTLEKIEKILLEGGDELEVNDEIAKKALIPLERMLELAGD